MLNTNDLKLMDPMQDLKNLKLIDGVFTPEEAREIIVGLLQYKIQFHDIKILSTEERFGKKDEHSIERVKELRRTRDEAKAMLDQLINSDQKLQISSFIQIDSVS